MAFIYEQRGRTSKRLPDLVLDNRCRIVDVARCTPLAGRSSAPRLKPAVTLVTLGEALAGAHRARWTDRQREGLRAFYEHTFGSVEWRPEIPEAYAILRGRSGGAGYTIAENDCWIAAGCVSHELPR